MSKRSRQDSESEEVTAITEPSDHAAKYEKVDSSSGGSGGGDGQQQDRRVVMKCLLPPHEPLSFPTYTEYDVHYQKHHTNRCLECRRNFPSTHYLNLHIAENHDPINEARKAKGEKIYACFVEGCDRVCSEPPKRRRHMIDKHQFPTFYDFFIVNTGIEGRNSMLRPGHAPGRVPLKLAGHKPAVSKPGPPKPNPSSNPAPQSPQQPASAADADSAMDICTPAPPPGPPSGLQQSKHAPSASSPSYSLPTAAASKPPRQTPTADSASAAAPAGPTAPAGDPMDGLTQSMSSLRFVPPSVRFGRGGKQGGLARK